MIVDYRLRADYKSTASKRASKGQVTLWLCFVD
jgi:hypothetical protein